MISEPGIAYGPHIAGPEGCTTFEIFSNLRAKKKTGPETAPAYSYLDQHRIGYRVPVAPLVPVLVQSPVARAQTRVRGTQALSDRVDGSTRS